MTTRAGTTVVQNPAERAIARAERLPFTSPHHQITKLPNPSSPSSLCCSLDPSIPRSRDPSRRSRAAFSLLEMMIAIVILGIGLIMVATMFPVAWTRARTLSETTVERAIAAGAQATLAQSLSPTRLKPTTFNDPSTSAPLTLPALSAGGLLGDFAYSYIDDQSANAVYDLVIAPSDTRVHALNMSNLKVSDLDGPFIDEDPWELENGIMEYFKPGQALKALYDNLGAKSPFVSQLPFTQRVYPPLPPRPDTADQAALAQWRDQLDQRRFVTAILHRLQNRIGPNDPGLPVPRQVSQEAQSAMSKPRIFDMYYVTLRKPNPTNRYARQDPTSAPDNNPWAIDSPPPAPLALTADQDLVFPVPWRVEVEFHAPPTVFKTVTATSTGPTGVPTEILVPRTGSSSALPVSFFQIGSRFIDEVSGNTYRVANRRITVNGSNQSAYLTLDREVFIDDLDFMNPSDPSPDGVLQPEELVRTVWVFPPAVDRSVDPPNFDGPSPVVSVEVRTMTLSPSN